MIKLLLRKCLQGLMMVLLVSAVTFALLGFAGGDALTQLRDNPQISDQTIERLRSVYGLDQPLSIRYFRWLSSAITGDLGESTYFRVPVSGLVWTRSVSTFLLGTAAFAIALTLAVPLSLIGARYKSTTIAALIDFVILATASTPRIVLALVALAISVRLTASARSSGVLFWLAALALSAPLISAFLAQFHGELQRTMREDFIKLARAKGLRESAVILRHAVRPALNPLLTIAGLSLGGVLGGSVIVESVLGRPGIGALMVSAVRGRDLPLVMGIVLFTSTAVWLGNALGDLLQAINDKRIRDLGF
ncbi:MAG TPA: ABC transporter permease [Pyrinomonadaceae bacterium]|jgi:peptide/nickel transport system permease protein|nr:ABC transporter permease [Pyrinomonadaceae bacterium]